MTQAVQTSGLNKQMDFYYRAKKEYQSAAKPFTYQLNLVSTQPKPKKFMIIINKFIDVLKQGMKQQYSSQQQLRENYWNELQKYYGQIQYEMGYIVENSYQKKKNKLRLYFGLLLHNKKIFESIRQITQLLGYMYVDPQGKIKQLQKLFEPLYFLKDGQYHIMSEFVNEYQKYEQKKKEQHKLKQRLAQKQKRKLEESDQKKRKKQQQQKRQKQLRQKQLSERLQKLQKQRKAKQQQRINNAVNTTKVGQQKILDDLIGFIPQNYRTHYAQDKNVQLMQRKQQNRQALDQLPTYGRAKKHQKNSQVLYEQRYKDQFEVFSFKLKPDFQTVNKDPSKKQKCFQCGRSLTQGFYLFGGNQNQCMYTAEWYCNQHMAQQRISIPWKALQNFDLRGYPVSRKSYIEINSYFQKPIIEIKSQEPVVRQSRQLYDFMVLKRQIHLMYDSICDLELMQPLLKKRLNYCIKTNLFSLKNLYDIHNGHQGPSLEREYDILSKHFYRCPQCQKRKGYICPKCKDPVKIFAFQLKQTHGCTKCRKLFHRKCLTGAKCNCQEEQ